MIKPKIGKNAKVAIKWEVQSIDYTKEAENTIIANAAKKYGIDKKQIIVQPVFVSEVNGKALSLAEDSDMNVLDLNFQHSLFKEYLSKNNINANMSEIEKIDSMINETIDYDSYTKTRKYKIKSIRWSNFLSYGEDNYIDLTTFHGLILLNGEPANKSGKSTFANDLIRFALFGKTKSGKADKFEDYFNNYLPDNNEVFVECTLEIGGDDYIIRRKLIRPDKSKKTKQITNKVEWYRKLPNGVCEELDDENDVKETNLQGESIRKTNKIIKETIGSDKDFDLIVSADSKDLDELISMKDTDRGRTLSRWTGLSILEEKERKAKEIFNNNIKPGRLMDIYDRGTLNIEIDTLNKEMVENQKIIDENNKKINCAINKIEVKKKDRDNLLMCKKPIDTSISGIDIKTLRTEKDRIKDMGLSKKAKIAQLNQEISEIGDVVFDINEMTRLNELHNRYVSKIGEIKGAAKTLQNEVKRLQDKEICEHSKQKCQFLDNTRVIKEKNDEINSLNKEWEKLAKENDSLKEQINEIDTKYKLHTEKNKKQIELSALEREIKTLQEKWLEKNNIEKKLKESENIIRENNEIDAKIRIIDAEITAEDKIRVRLMEENVASKKDIEINERDILDRKRIISQIEKENETDKMWKIYLDMIGKDGISKYVLNNLLPRINSQLESLLDDITDFNVEVEIDYKNDIHLWLVRDDVKTKLSAASGYEKTMAGLALRHILGRNSSLSKPPFLLLDEILGGIAKENYDDVKKLYDKIVPAYDFVFHITHLSDIADWHDSIITIQKINDISCLKTEK